MYKNIKKVCLENYRKIMLDTINNGMNERGGVITDEYNLRETKIGTTKMIKQHCESGYIADWHSHPPNHVMRSPKGDVYFLPPSEADIYTALINATLGRNKYSVVFSVEGVYILKIKKKAIEDFKKELISNNIGTDDKDLLECGFSLEPEMKNGYFYGFKKSKNYPFLSNIFANGFIRKILMYEKTFGDAIKKYKEYLKPYGIKCKFIVPDDILKNKD